MQIKLMVKNHKYGMTKYILVLNNHLFSSNFRYSLANKYDFSVIAILKKNKQMKIKSN